MMTREDAPTVDVVIIGAGLSGIGAAYHIQHSCPYLSYTVLEGRSSMGGTWDLFKYPGIRSDSDMYTLGFSFDPWKDPQAIADGPSILQYIKDTAHKFGIDKKIQFDHKVIDADWSDTDKLWTLKIAEHENVPATTIRCKFLMTCCGYYDYAQGHTPAFPNSEAFQGPIIHPQHWDTTLDYSGKNVVVIGSGATAVTLVPEMAKKAAKVTMLQRSPTYMIAMPREDKVANMFRKLLPGRAAYQLSRWKNIFVSLGFYKVSRQWPKGVSRYMQKGVQKALGESYRAEDFAPRYDPWDQRLCIVPDGDLFRAIKKGKAEVVTDTIERFTPKGVLLSSGKELEADIIVTATGLKVQLLGGMALRVNGRVAETKDIHCYRGVMFSDIPNFAVAIGYTNASWTLKCDLSCGYVARVLDHMHRKGYSTCTPRFDASRYSSEPLLDFDAGYIKRAEGILPQQGSKAPWKVYQNYFRDSLSLKYSGLQDGHLEFR
jgi:monooxygenase